MEEQQEHGWDLICVFCGTIVPVKDAKGSFKRPYCKKCYEKLYSTK